jgi:hypothetical protein
MKRIMILTAAAIVLTSCGALFMPYEPQQRMELASFLDFRPYTSAGFFISPDAYTGEFEPLGQLYIEIYPEEIEISESKRLKYNEPHYVNGILYAYEHIKFAEVLDKAVAQAMKMGADGIADLKIQKITFADRVRYEASGLCIKRK